ncbi:MAG: hypothetical protein ACXAB4_06375 [Candidatus Hodarchaeales archaeon]|jgi:hypothetical protein
MKKGTNLSHYRDLSIQIEITEAEGVITLTQVNDEDIVGVLKRLSLKIHELVKEGVSREILKPQTV